MSPSSSRGQAPGKQASPAATARRIAVLEDDLSEVIRQLTPCLLSFMRTREGTEGVTVSCPQCGGLIVIGKDRLVPRHGCASGEWAEELTAQRARLEEDIERLRAEMAERRSSRRHRSAPQG